MKGALKEEQLTPGHQWPDWRRVDVINLDVMDYSASILATGQAV